MRPRDSRLISPIPLVGAPPLWCVDFGTPVDGVANESTRRRGSWTAWAASGLVKLEQGLDALRGQKPESDARGVRPAEITTGTQNN